MSGRLQAIGGAAGTIGGIASNVGGAVAGLSNAASDITALLNGGYGAITGLGVWASTLQPASFRGVPFGVFQSTIKTGRRTAVHTYPFRDVVWVEDLGLGTRTFTFRGYLVGDNVFTQRDSMVNALETAGPGALVHPSLGTRNVSLIESSLSETKEQGRVVELELTFMQTITVVAPQTVAQTQQGVLGAVGNAVSTVASDFQTFVAGPLALGAQVVQSAISTVSTFTGAVGQLVGNANLIFGSVDSLVSSATSFGGVFGRYTAGNVSAPAPTSATTTTALAQAITSRTATTNAAAAVTAATAGLAPSSTAALSSEMYALTEQLRTSATDPADAVQVLSSLVSAAPPPAASPAGSAPIASAIATAQVGVSALCRRSTLASLANACATYQPTSSNDAQALQAMVTALFDSEITIAGDLEEDATYLALRTMRTAVVKDLVVRGANLPALMTASTGEPQPALTLAYRFYQDATRADDLIARVNPIHPAFFPTTMKVLSS
jgi:prophage DNA circulation protein